MEACNKPNEAVVKHFIMLEAAAKALEVRVGFFRIFNPNSQFFFFKEFLYLITRGRVELYYLMQKSAKNLL